MFFEVVVVVVVMKIILLFKAYTQIALKAFVQGPVTNRETFINIIFSKTS